MSNEQRNEKLAIALSAMAGRREERAREIAEIESMAAGAISLPVTVRVEILERELRRHDWYHFMSDSHSVWVAGEAHWRLIGTVARLVPWDEVCRLWGELVPTPSKDPSNLYSETPPEKWRSDNGGQTHEKLSR